MLMNKNIREQALDLVNTSVQDMQSGLYAYGKSRLAILRYAHKTVVRRGEKTKAKILAAHIKKVQGR